MGGRSVGEEVRAGVPGGARRAESGRYRRDDRCGPHTSRWEGLQYSALRLGARRLLRGSAPSFLVVGTRRGGSTSLYQWIVRHPDVLPSRTRKGSHYFDVNHGRGFRWFCSTFPTAAAGQITGEASPYYMFHPLAPVRIAQELPDVRLLAVLREPVARAYSHYQFSRRYGLEQLSLEAALDAEESRLAGERERMIAEPGYESFAWRHYSYLARGRYAEQLEVLTALFSPQQLLVIQSEALFADPNGELPRVWDFLGVPRRTLSDLEAFKTAAYEPIPPKIRRRMTEYFAPHNERLYAMPGIQFRWPAPWTDEGLETGSVPTPHEGNGATG